jgi:hypothetical protein
MSMVSSPRHQMEVDVVFTPAVRPEEDPVLPTEQAAGWATLLVCRLWSRQMLPLPGTEPSFSGDQSVTWSLYRLGYCGREFRITCDVLVRECPGGQCALPLGYVTVQLVTDGSVTAAARTVYRRARNLPTFYCSSPSAYSCFPSI